MGLTIRSSISIQQGLLLSLILVILLAACGNGETTGDGNRTAAEDPARSNPHCTPGEVEGNPIVQPDRRLEDIIFSLTGARQSGDLDPVEETIDDPNFGGVWGDFAGGVVVAVLDCSAVDVDEIARLAGGPEYLHLIEVSHTFRQVDAFRDDLASELASLGVGAELLIDSTLTGRHITVQLPDPGRLGSDFGSAVPEHLFSVAKGDLFAEQ